MKILSVNTHLTYPGWSEGKLNLAFMDLAKAFFVERGHQVAETFVERGYDPEEEVKKHAAADLVHPPDAGELVLCAVDLQKICGRGFNVGLAKEVFLAGDGRTRQDPSRQYGTGGKMQGKKFMICATWNAPREAFDNPNGVLYAGKGTADLFLHITSNYKFTGYDTTSGIWRNTTCALKILFHGEHSLTQSNSSWVGSSTTTFGGRRGISLARFLRHQLTASVINPAAFRISPNVGVFG